MSIVPKTTDVPPSLRRVNRFILQITVFCALLLVAVGALTIALFAEAGASHANTRVLAACEFHKSIADAAIPAKTSELGLKIIAGSRTFYEVAGCNLGPLKPADPRVVPYLPKGVR